MVAADFTVTPSVVFSENNAGGVGAAVGGLLGRFGGGGAALGGYTNTNEGKVITASFLDNWNNIVRAIRDNASLVQGRAGPASQANAAASVQANAPAEGDVLIPRIAGAKVLRSPQEGAPELMALARGDEVLYLGEEQNGYLKVTGTNGDGWIRKILVNKR